MRTLQIPRWRDFRQRSDADVWRCGAQSGGLRVGGACISEDVAGGADSNNDTQRQRPPAEDRGVCLGPLRVAETQNQVA